MRFCLTFELKEKNFPIEYRKTILSFIKNALIDCNDGVYYEKYFKDTIQKDYCFSVFLPKPKFNKDIIEIKSNKIKINFSTDDTKNTGLILFNCFISRKNKIFPLSNNNHMILKEIYMTQQELITNSKAIFKTSAGNGICIREHNKENNRDNYYTFSDKLFRDKFNIIVGNQLNKAGFTEDEIKKIKINPIQCKKAVIKHYERCIDVTTGIFEIEATSEILQYFYNVGIGSRKSSGFGMVDLLTQDLI